MAEFTRKPRKAGGGVGVLVEQLEARAFMTATASSTFDAMNPLSYTDEDNNRVTISMTGPGSGVVYFEEQYDTGSLSFSDAILLQRAVSMTMSGTTSLTDVRVTVVSPIFEFSTGKSIDKDTVISSVTVSGDLGSVNAQRLSFQNSFSISGGVGSLTLGNLVNSDAVLSIGGASPLSGGTKLFLGHVENLSIQAPEARIAQLVANNWLDSGGADDVVTAASIDALTITGGVGTGAAAGDFEAGLELSGKGVADDAPTLNMANIAGTIRDGVWDVTGNVERITTRLGADHWTLLASGLVAYVTTSRSLIGSEIHAQSLGLLSVRQHILDTQIVTGDGLDADQFSVGGVSVGGTVADSSVNANDTGVGTMLVTGNILNFDVSAGVLTRLNTGQSVYGSSIHASKIGTIFVSLDMVNSSISATAGLAEGEVSIGNLTVYAIGRQLTVISGGSVDNMRFGHLLESGVTVGASVGEGGLVFAQTESGEYARLGTLYLSATLGYTTEKAMRQSDIYVGHLGSARIYSVDEVAESSYGIFAVLVDAYQRRKPDGSVVKLMDLSNEGRGWMEADQAGGYRLIVVGTGEGGDE